MPLKNNQTSYQRLQNDLDYRLDQINRAEKAAYNAVHQSTANSNPSGYNQTIRRQRQLKQMGLYNGAIDGIWGKKSKAAHQAALNQGYVTDQYGIYARKPQPQRRVANKVYTEAQKQQAQLKRLGFYKGNIDGIVGQKTRAAHQEALDSGYTYKDGVYSKDASENSSNHVPENGGKIMYLHYPEYSNHSKNTITGDLGRVWNNSALSDISLPVGHDAVILVDKNGRTRYYEYGRINSAPNGSEIVGKRLQDSGNVRRVQIPDMKPNESNAEYIGRIKDILPYADAGKMDVSVAGNADIRGAIDFINSYANDETRDPYSLLNTCATFATNVYNGYRGNKSRTQNAINTLKDAVKTAPSIPNIINNVLKHGLISGIGMSIPGTTHNRYNSAKTASDESFTIEQ